MSTATTEISNIFTVEPEDSFLLQKQHPESQSQSQTNTLISDSPNDTQKSTERETSTTAFTDKNDYMHTSFNNSNNINNSGGVNNLTHSEFISPISPTFMLSSMASASPATENILSAAKERLQNIRSWKDFFSLDQFRLPESTTAAQSRISHNTSYFQNNYLIILLLLTGFSLLSNFSLLLVSAVILAGFYYLSTLKSDFKLNIGGQEISLQQLNYGWIILSIILLYLTSALSIVFWIISVGGVLIIAHSALHDIAIESEFNSV